MASGFTKKHPGDRDLELAVQSMRDEEYTEERENEENSDYTSTSESEYSDFSDEESSENESEEDDENERIIQAISSGVENLKIDKFGNYILED